MLQTLRFDQDAPWKQRFRAPAILWTQLAAANKTRGIVASTRSGTAQIYAWDVPTGSLQQVTQHEGGLYYAYLDAAGRSIYYHDDAQGNEMGHFVRVPFEGGTPEDITPDLPPYAFFGLQSSRANNLLASSPLTSKGSCSMAWISDPTGRSPVRARSIKSPP